MFCQPQKQHLNLSWKEGQFKEQSLYQAFSVLSTSISRRTHQTFDLTRTSFPLQAGNPQQFFFYQYRRSLLQKCLPFSKFRTLFWKNLICSTPMRRQEYLKAVFQNASRSLSLSRVSCLWRANEPRCRPDTLKVDSGKIPPIPNQH